MSDFDEIGGEFALRAVIDEFVETVFADTMIGYLFQRANKERVKRFEYEHAAQFLGAPVTYGGRDLAQAHKQHPIMGGHFGRRRQILKTVLEKHGIAPRIRDAWLAHQDALRSEVTQDRPDECNDVVAAARLPKREG